MTLSQLQRGHDWPACPSPREACTCGFSQAFWREVMSHKTEPELSVAGPTITAVNVSSTRLVTPAPMTAGRTALNPVSPGTVGFCRSCSEPLEDEAILAIHLAAGHQIGRAPLPDSGKKVTGSEAVRGFCEPNARKALAVPKTLAECGM